MTEAVEQTLSDQMREVLIDAMPEGDFVPSLLASQIADQLRATDPGFLADWLDERASNVLLIEIDRILRSDRTKARSRYGARAFAAAAATGDVVTLSAFTHVRFVVDDKNTRRALGDMTAADHLYVADKYEASGNRQLMLAAFHRAVAKRVGRKTTAEAMTEAQFRKLEDSILGG